jgi:hypothetical protein
MPDLGSAGLGWPTARTMSVASRICGSDAKNQGGPLRTEARLSAFCLLRVVGNDVRPFGGGGERSIRDPDIPLL